MNQGALLGRCGDALGCTTTAVQWSAPIFMSVSLIWPSGVRERMTGGSDGKGACACARHGMPLRQHSIQPSVLGVQLAGVCLPNSKHDGIHCTQGQPPRHTLQTHLVIAGQCAGADRHVAGNVWTNPRPQRSHALLPAASEAMLPAVVGSCGSQAQQCMQRCTTWSGRGSAGCMRLSPS